MTSFAKIGGIGAHVPSGVSGSSPVSCAPGHDLPACRLPCSTR